MRFSPGDQVMLAKSGDHKSCFVSNLDAYVGKTGLVTSVPTDDGKAVLVRFPDSPHGRKHLQLVPCDWLLKEEA